MQTYTEAANDPVGYFRFSQFDGFGQDSWRIAKNFSVEIGLRFSHYIPTYTTANNMSNFVPSLYDPSKAVSMTLAGLIVPNSGNPYNGLVRVGDIPSDLTSRVAGDPAAIAAIPVAGPRGLLQRAEPLDAALQLRVGAFQEQQDQRARRLRHLSRSARRQPRLLPDQASALHSAGAVSVQQSLQSLGRQRPGVCAPGRHHRHRSQPRRPRGLHLQLRYSARTSLGHAARHRLCGQCGPPPDSRTEYQRADVRSTRSQPGAAHGVSRPATNSILPYKGYTGISFYKSDSNSNYNALQVRATKRRGNALFTINYTWSHALSDTPGNFNSTTDAIEFDNRHFNYGPTNYDRRQLFVVTYTYRIPFMAKSKGVMHGAFGGWEISGVGRIQTGQYLTPVGSNFIPGTRRAQYLGLPVASDNPTVNLWFNKAAFANAPAAAEGNAGVGIIEGPGWSELGYLAAQSVHHSRRLVATHPGGHLQPGQPPQLRQPRHDGYQLDLRRDQQFATGAQHPVRRPPRLLTQCRLRCK